MKACTPCKLLPVEAIVLFRWTLAPHITTLSLPRLSDAGLVFNGKTSIANFVVAVWPFTSLHKMLHGYKREGLPLQACVNQATLCLLHAGNSPNFE